MRDGDWVLLAHCDPLPQGAGATLKAGDIDAIKNAKITSFELYNLRDDLKQAMRASTRFSWGDYRPRRAAGL